MSQIYDALGYLFQSIEFLENSLRRQESKLAQMRQQELINARRAQGNVHVMDSGLLARKLDVAIEKVEQVLKEG